MIIMIEFYVGLVVHWCLSSLKDLFQEMHIVLLIQEFVLAIGYLTIFIDGLIILSWFVLRGLIYLEATILIFYFLIINPGLKMKIIIRVLNGEESLFVWSEFIV